MRNTLWTSCKNEAFCFETLHPIYQQERNMATQHTPGQVADFPADDDLAGQLHWADKHANDLAMAEHNRRHFAAEAVRLRAAIAKLAA